MASSVDPDQTAVTGSVCYGSTLFASILNLSVMLGNYLQQTTFSGAFFLGALRVNLFSCFSCPRNFVLVLRNRGHLKVPFEERSGSVRLWLQVRDSPEVLCCVLEQGALSWFGPGNVPT